MVRFILASQSPARLTTLRNAGIEPTVIVSHVDEDAILDRMRIASGALDPAPTVLELARAKCEAVAQEAPAALISDEVATKEGKGAVVLGCDSMLEMGGDIVGKPHTPEIAAARWREMRGTSAVLHTGHWMILLDDSGNITGTVGGTSSTIVHFADVTDAEIDAYVATGEPLHVAGAFTIDGYAGPFIEGIEGDHHGVLGLSLPLARRLARELAISWPDLWNK